MRDELVRLTGTREAADDPGAGANHGWTRRQYVQIERGTTLGSTQVLFDATALRAASSSCGTQPLGP